MCVRVVAVAAVHGTAQHSAEGQSQEIAARGLQHIYAISGWFWSWEIELQALYLSSAPRLKCARAITKDYVLQVHSACNAARTANPLSILCRSSG